MFKASCAVGVLAIHNILLDMILFSEAALDGAGELHVEGMFALFSGSIILRDMYILTAHVCLCIYIFIFICNCTIYILYIYICVFIIYVYICVCIYIYVLHLSS